MSATAAARLDAGDRTGDERHEVADGAAVHESAGAVPEADGRQGAVEQDAARIVYGVMRFGVAYMKQTEEAYAEEVRERLEKQLQRRAAELGFEVKRKGAEAASE